MGVRRWWLHVDDTRDPADGDSVRVEGTEEEVREEVSKQQAFYGSRYRVWYEEEEKGCTQPRDVLLELWRTAPVAPPDPCVSALLRVVLDAQRAGVLTKSQASGLMSVLLRQSGSTQPPHTPHFRSFS